MHLILHVLAFVGFHHPVSRASGIFVLIVMPTTLILSAVLGPKRRYLVYLFIVAITAIFYLIVYPMLPPIMHTNLAGVREQ
jgi:hypothetical protein